MHHSIGKESSKMKFNVRFVAHSVIRIFGKMNYRIAPNFRGSKIS